MPGVLSAGKVGNHCWLERNMEYLAKLAGPATRLQISRMKMDGWIICDLLLIMTSNPFSFSACLFPFLMSKKKLGREQPERLVPHPA